MFKLFKKKKKNLFLFSKKNGVFILILILALILAFVSGWVARSSFYGPNDHFLSGQQKEGNYHNTFSDGWLAAKKKIEESGRLLTAFETKEIQGEIIEKGEGFLIIGSSLLNPLDDEKLQTRKVFVPENTQIILETFPGPERLKQDQDEKGEDIAILQAEQEASNDEEEINRLQEEIDYIFMSIGAKISQKNINLDDLQVGQEITAIANENIAKEEEFKAIRIESQIKTE